MPVHIKGNGWLTANEVAQLVKALATKAEDLPDYLNAILRTAQNRTVSLSQLFGKPLTGDILPN